MSFKSKISYQVQENSLKGKNPCVSFTQQEAIEEFDELKRIALSCYDKNGNPNISAAIKAAENKAKIAGLYARDNNLEIGTIVKMGEITIDGQQLKLNIGEDLFE